MIMAEPRALIFEFVSEAREHLAAINNDLVALEQGPDDTARYRIDRLFRSVHSVKGGAGFFGCRTVEELAHAMENVLEDIRQRGEPPEAPVIDALLAGADRIVALLDDVERCNEVDVSNVLVRLRGLLSTAPTMVSTTSLPRATVARSGPVLSQRPAEHSHLYALTIDLARCERQGIGPTAAFQQLEASGTLLDGCLDVPGEGLDVPLPEGPIVYRAIVSTTLPPEPFAQKLGLPGVEITVLEPPSVPRPEVASVIPTEPVAVAPERSNTLRIPVQLIDRLMTLAGELVLVRNQALRAVGDDDLTLRPIVQGLDSVTSDLQDAVMRTRMQPVANLFGKFPRLVRDLARQLDKQITLEVSGTEVELDKSILEALSDPLTHLVRNCCDHGIETPALRRHSGKPETGHITLSARHLGGQIYLDVRDDGKGIDADAIKRKAQQLGLRTAAELARLGDKDLFGLIMLPGFSTAPGVTDLSGRGVGMDVVKTNLDRLGGVLEIESTPGHGSVFRLRLPLTLAIIPCLLVVSGRERYALPQKDLEELVCLHPGLTRSQIEYAFDREVVRLRDRLLPLVRLGEVLKRSAPFTDGVRAEITRHYQAQAAQNGNAESTTHFLAVVKAGGERFGLIVDNILNTEEIVVKPMHTALKGLPCFAGATILGDGRVALILSLEGIARHAGVTFGEITVAAPTEGEEQMVEAQTLLLFQYGPGEHFAVPLAMVRRLEFIRTDQIERVGDEEFLTIEGVSTPVLRLDRYLSVSPCPEQSQMFLLLPKNLRRPLGILLSGIVDTLTIPVNLDPEAYRADGLLGSAVVRGRMTLFLDVYRLADLNSAPAPLRPRGLPGERKRVLLVEDTQFFRQLVKGYLEGLGCEVEVAHHGAEGLAKLDEATFDLVVADIEMPVMDGWTFAKALRQRPEGAGLPLMALTTLSSEQDRERALACGFDRHEVKIDRERFLAAVKELLDEKSMR
jgi:two-component system chemotaxis sensor kinase CheA